MPVASEPGKQDLPSDHWTWAGLIAEVEPALVCGQTGDTRTARQQATQITDQIPPVWCSTSLPDPRLAPWGHSTSSAEPPGSEAAQHQRGTVQTHEPAHIHRPLPSPSCNTQQRKTQGQRHAGLSRLVIYPSRASLSCAVQAPI